jgi:thioredoxin reductase/bacterioferritin-associated ferredoxin
MTSLPDAVDVAIVGAGPAGMAAAIVLARSGVSVALLDEGANPGGQIYRSVGVSPYQPGNWLGQDYWQGSALVREFAQSGTLYVDRTLVWAVHPGADGHRLVASRDGAAQEIAARRIIIATGAIERPFPIPGWTLPGVLSAGAAQIALKSSALVPEGRIVLAGTGPLLYLLASQYQAAGVPIAVLLDMTPAGGWRRAATAAPQFLTSPYFRKGLALRSAVGKAMRIERGIVSVRALGTGRLERVAWTDRDGREHELPLDWLLLHQGVAPNLNLPRATGCALRWNAERLAFEPQVDFWGESSVGGIFVAGDGAGIVGAQASAAQGRLAALQAATQIGAMRQGVRDAAATMVRRQLRRHLRGRAFLDRYFRPADALRLPSGDTVVCRCEEVTEQQILDAVGQGAVGPNQMKAYLRCGMGPCQGRYCGLTVSELIAAATRRPVSAVGYLRLRNPVKPVTLGELAGLPTEPTAQTAVDAT